MLYFIRLNSIMFQPVWNTIIRVKLIRMRLIITHFIASTLFIWAAIMLMVCFNCLADLPATITYDNVGYGLHNSSSRETPSCRSSIYSTHPMCLTKQKHTTSLLLQVIFVMLFFILLVLFWLQLWTFVLNKAKTADVWY